MRKIMILLVIISGLIAVLAAKGFTTGSKFGVVVDFTGKAYYKASDSVKDWTSVSYFVTLPEGARIKTEKNSTIVIQKNDGTLLRVFQNAQISLSGTGSKSDSAKAITVPAKINNALREKLEALKQQFSQKKPRYSISSAYQPEVMKSSAEPTICYYAPIYLPEKTIISRASAVFAWDGLEEAGTIKIFEAGKSDRLIYSGSTQGSSFTLPGSSGLLAGGMKYTAEIEIEGIKATEECEIISGEQEKGLEKDLKAGALTGNPEEMTPMDLIMLGTLYESYGMYNDALNVYKTLKKKQADMGEACISGLKKGK